MKGIIQSVAITHKCPFSDDRVVKMSRMVVWATMETGECVWVRTVEGGLDHTYNEVKIAFFQEFFNGLVGQTIEFESGKYGGFFVKSHSVPFKFSNLSYPEIKYEMEEWVEENCAELVLCLNKRKAAKAAATKRKAIEYAEQQEKWRRRDIKEYGLREDASEEEINTARDKKYEEERRVKERKELEEKAIFYGLDSSAPSDEIWAGIFKKMQKNMDRQVQEARREEKRRNAMKLAFRKGTNRANGAEQWEAKKDGIIYILERRQSYDSASGEVSVEKVRDLVPGRLILVKQI